MLGDTLDMGLLLAVLASGKRRLGARPGAPVSMSRGPLYTTIFGRVRGAGRRDNRGVGVDAGENKRRESQSRSKSTSSAQDVTPKSC